MLKPLLALLLAAAIVPSALADDGALPPIIVYAPTPCLACIDWADHLRQAGFAVAIEEKDAAVRANVGTPAPVAEDNFLTRLTKERKEATSVSESFALPFSKSTFTVFLSRAS